MEGAVGRERPAGIRTAGGPDPDAEVRATGEPSTGEPPSGEPPPAELDRADRPPLDIVAALRLATWVDGVCLGGIVLSVVSRYVTLPLAPLLLRHVLTHLFVTGSITALLTGGAASYAGTLPFGVAVLAGVVGIAKFDPFYFWAGRRYGDHVAHFLETHGGIRPRTVAWVERWIARFGLPLLVVAPFLPIPSFLVFLLLGASGVRWIWFVVYDAIGWALWCAVFVALGHHFHAQVDHIASVVTHYSRLSTFVLIGVVVLVTAVRGARQQRSRPAA